MRTLDVAALSLENMRGRKLRSWLTILGIVIAVASIVVLISLAFGIDQQISSRLNQLGDDVIQVTPGSTRAIRGDSAFGMQVHTVSGPRPGGTFGGIFERRDARLTFDDAEQLSRVDGVAYVDARLQGSKRISYKGKNSTAQVIGVDPSAFKEISTAALFGGKLLNSNDKYSVVIGYRIYESTFPGEELLNRQIRVGDYSFRVVGILNQSSGSFVTSDNAIYMPVQVAKAVLNESEEASQIFIKVKEGSDPDVVAAALYKKLLELHRLPEGQEDFTITTASFFQSTVADITNMLALFLGGIAAISLLVGAIGVANTMFMSVLERTKEIGILKALGMKDSEVTAMFLVEAAAIGALGGTIGVLLSVLISSILGRFGVPSLITLELVLGALFFSALVGIVSGTIPAGNAAKLQPVEALRYE